MGKYLIDDKKMMIHRTAHIEGQCGLTNLSLLKRIEINEDREITALVSEEKYARCPFCFERLN
ncbi:hypothetical protein [Pseudalkalibacillus caeni]|uniref:Uncharacterized protein n=1 Tax=Exobacillus caeni TaxID=2574798 RepID=A0A5R9EY64_9BACL|nr:hypothetical protein [Pseudalkalibacillus caeni]TLS36057.1 hypothetical protein FCL54_16835 [Pseudalkalibacillus caeni]